MASWSVPQQVWPVTRGAGTTVAVIDSGAQATAPDLRGTVLSGSDTVAPGGNGDQDYAPAPGHGTLISELIAGQGTGGGPVGLAPRARILPIRADGPGPASNTSVPDGIMYAVNHGADVIDLPTGLPSGAATWCAPGTQNAVSYALAHDVVVISSAGADNLPRRLVEPASCSGVLAVGGIEPGGQLWKNTTMSPYVSVAAPADRVPVADANGRPTTASGTSYASSLVAATAALIRSRYPKMPWYQVDQRIIDTAATVPPAKDNDYGFGYGYGVLNVAKAVNASKYPVPASGANPVYTRYAAWLNTMNGEDWARANGVAVPSLTAAPGDSAAGASSSPIKLLSSNMVAAIAVAAIVFLVLVGAALTLILRSRRKRRSAPASATLTDGHSDSTITPPGGYPSIFEAPVEATVFEPVGETNASEAPAEATVLEPAEAFPVPEPEAGSHQSP